MGPWARAFLEKFDVPPGVDTSAVRDLRIEPSLISARVGDETVTLSAPPIPGGIWAAIEPVRTDVQSESLMQTLEHTWEEPLTPADITTVGSRNAVVAAVEAIATAIEREPSVFLRWRGFGDADPQRADAWDGGALPGLPAAARRPPDSVPKRFGTSGVAVQGEDLVEPLVRVYEAFGS